MINEKIGLPATLAMAAEEAVEFAHACQKMERVLRGENPTPVTRQEAADAIEEEAADVMICIEELWGAGVIQFPVMRLRMKEKLERAEERLKDV